MGSVALPMPLVSRYVDPMALNGPWRSLRSLALTSEWTLKAVKARGWHHDAYGGIGALTDSLSLRGWHERNEVGDVDRFVAIWSRPTWPTLGRVKRGVPEVHVGEGRADSTGKTWLWHPPMAPHPDVVEVPWKFTFGWTWTVGTPIMPASAAQVRDWIRRERV